MHREEYTNFEWLKLNYFVLKQIETKLGTLDEEKIDSKFDVDIGDDVRVINLTLCRGWKRPENRKRCVHVIKASFKELNLMCSYHHNKEDMNFSFRGIKL